VPDASVGRALVTRRALADLVRAATLGSYGVTGFAARLPERVLGSLGIGHPGVRVGLDDGLWVELDLTVAHGLPIAEVARQVDSAVRYSVRRATGRELSRLTIHVDGLESEPLAAVPDRPGDGRQAGRTRSRPRARKGSSEA
jgi:uncharacterized alkaline shock family protein YloU